MKYLILKNYDDEGWNILNSATSLPEAERDLELAQSISLSGSEIIMVQVLQEVTGTEED